MESTVTQRPVGWFLSLSLCPFSRTWAALKDRPKTTRPPASNRQPSARYPRFFLLSFLFYLFRCSAPSPALRCARLQYSASIIFQLHNEFRVALNRISIVQLSVQPETRVALAKRKKMEWSRWTCRTLGGVVRVLKVRRGSTALIGRADLGQSKWTVGLPHGLLLVDAVGCRFLRFFLFFFNRVFFLNRVDRNAHDDVCRWHWNEQGGDSSETESAPPADDEEEILEDLRFYNELLTKMQHHEQSKPEVPDTSPFLFKISSTSCHVWVIMLRFFSLGFLFDSKVIIFNVLLFPHFSYEIMNSTKNGCNWEKRNLGNQFLFGSALSYLDFFIHWTFTLNALLRVYGFVLLVKRHWFAWKWSNSIFPSLLHL